ncbi:hypothetical protein J4558_03540 [Leptolyngbya sp. 15MV]|nr:hypothetical protein J4558_03540 [Leptolyngbya sp. 15MV]
MNDNDALELASLLCSRLCHDMLSPVGALSNGLELLATERDPEMRQRCFELLEQSARISTDKLKFFRLAFGAAGGFGEYVEVAEPKALIEALVGESRRIEIHWALEEAKMPKPAVKVLLNFAQIAIDALVRGGTLDLGAELRDGAYEIVVRATDQLLCIRHPHRRQQRQRHRQVVVRPFLGQVGGRQVDGDPLGRQCQPHRGKRGAHPLLALAHRLVGQPDDVEPGQPRRDRALDLDRARFQPEIGDRPDECDHEFPLRPCHR